MDGWMSTCKLGILRYSVIRTVALSHGPWAAPTSMHAAISSVELTSLPEENRKFPPG